MLPACPRGLGAEPRRTETGRAVPSRAEPSRAEPSRAGPGRAGQRWAGQGRAGQGRAVLRGPIRGARCPARPGERHSRSRPAAQLLLPSHGNRPLWEVTSRRAQPIPDPSFKSAPPFPRFPARNGLCGGPARDGAARHGWARHRAAPGGTGRHRALRLLPPAPACVGGCCAAGRSPPLPPSAASSRPDVPPAAAPLGRGRGEQHPCTVLHLRLTSLSPSSALPSLPFPSFPFPSPFPFPLSSFSLSPSLSLFPWPFLSPHLFPFHPFSFRIPDPFSLIPFFPFPRHAAPPPPPPPAHAAHLSHTLSSPRNALPVRPPHLGAAQKTLSPQPDAGPARPETRPGDAPAIPHRSSLFPVFPQF
ncbi:vegetative cell wall protein gp1-like [Corvus moneduloides]|uniref:vegetative cell wall protein gp1-like n=1 Tax=Corvus moneduloides TaxID=1196302 RepID=UPI0013622E87|nr:vegetative cell wall protein gp1-like [Corvus moneduloides]